MPSIFISSHCSWLPKQGENSGKEGGAVGHMTCAMPTISEVRRRKICRKIISIYLIFCCICLASLSAFPLLSIFLCFCFFFIFCRLWSSSLVAAWPEFYLSINKLLLRRSWNAAKAARVTATFLGKSLIAPRDREGGRSEKGAQMNPSTALGRPA